MRVLVTGATGVIGRRLVPLLRSSGHTVTGVARSPGGRAQLEHYGATAIDLDLFDPGAIRRATDGQEVVINLATHIPHPSTRVFLPWAWKENDRLRREAAAALVNACMETQVSRFIQESFAPVYPDCGDRWIDERTPLKPVRYNRTVADAEASANRFSEGGGSGVILRFGAFYGADAYQTIEMIQWVRKGWAALPGSSSAFVSSVSHDDAAAAAAAAITLPPGAYNVVDDDPVTHRVFFDSMAATLGVDPPRLPPPWITFLFGSLGRMLARSLRISNRKLRASSQWRPKYRSVREGWAAVIAELAAAEASASSGGRSANNRA